MDRATVSQRSETNERGYVRSYEGENLSLYLVWVATLKSKALPKKALTQVALCSWLDISISNMIQIAK